jgi:hypothetical protein
MLWLSKRVHQGDEDHGLGVEIHNRSTLDTDRSHITFAYIFWTCRFSCIFTQGGIELNLDKDGRSPSLETELPFRVYDIEKLRNSDRKRTK